MEEVEKSEEAQEDASISDENRNEKLLNELIQEIEKFLKNNKKQVECLAEIIKRIFYCGLTVKGNVR